MEIERIPITTKKIDYAVIARLLGLDQFNPGNKLSLANVRLDSSLDTGSIPQLEGLLDLFKKHKIEEPETLLTSLTTTSAASLGDIRFQPSILGNLLNAYSNNVNHNDPTNTAMARPIMTTSILSNPLSAVSIPSSATLPSTSFQTPSVVPPSTLMNFRALQTQTSSSSLQPPPPSVLQSSTLKSGAGAIPFTAGISFLQTATASSTTNQPITITSALLNSDLSLEIFRDSVDHFSENWYGSFNRNMAHKYTQNTKMLLHYSRRTLRRKK